MKKEIKRPFLGQQCFFCGKDNPAGLKLKFYYDEETKEVSTEYRAAAPFTGFGRVLHGGMQCGLLDEIMGWTAIYLSGEMGVTIELNVQFLRPAVIGEMLHLYCRLVEKKGRRVHLEARIETDSGEECATATGAYRLLSKPIFEELTGEFDENDDGPSVFLQGNPPPFAPDEY